MGTIFVLFYLGCFFVWLLFGFGFVVLVGLVFFYLDCTSAYNILKLTVLKWMKYSSWEPTSGNGEKFHDFSREIPLSVY